jgi:RNA polymerase sigma factor (sigma-70 family)
MPTACLNNVLDRLREAVGPPNVAGPTDKELLARFVAARDQSAFALLVRRHGAMVLGVCRRVLRHEQDAEDAFQAAFLVLARKAGSMRWSDTVAPWLYEVANRTAREARARLARRRARETPVEHVRHPEVGPSEPQDWRPVLDQEVRRLPGKYRDAVVLCDLEGKARKEAAQQLGLPEGTLSSRLVAARRLLARRLARRGLALSGGALGQVVAHAATAQVPAALAGVTVRGAAGVATGELTATGPAVLLMKGVIETMLTEKLKVSVGALVVVAALAVGGIAYRPGPSSATAEGLRSERQERTNPVPAPQGARKRAEDRGAGPAASALVVEEIRARRALAKAYLGLADLAEKKCRARPRPDDHTLARLREEQRSWLRKAADEYDRLAKFLEGRDVARPVTKEDQVADPFDVAQRHFAVGEYEAAARAYAQLVERCRGKKEELKALGGLVRCHAALGQRGRVKKDLQAIRAVLPRLPEAERGAWQEWLTQAEKGVGPAEGE